MLTYFQELFSTSCSRVPCLIATLVTRTRYGSGFSVKILFLGFLDSVYGRVWLSEARISEAENGHSESLEKVAGELSELQQGREVKLQKCKILN